MKKNKNTELNFLYLGEVEEQNKKEEKKQPKAKQAPKKAKTQTRKKKKEEETSDVFDFDREIVIGVTKLPTPKEKNQKKAKKQGKKETKQQVPTSNKTEPVSKAKKKKITKGGKEKKLSPPVKKKTKKVKKSHPLLKKIVKWTILLVALLAAILFFLLSPLFSITQIQVVGNSKIQAPTILSLSQIQEGENMFRISARKIEEAIKQEPYIESVKMTRKLPDKIEIQVKERVATYQIEYAGSYAYINNQGYILELTQEKMDKPVLVGIEDINQEIKPGMRLSQEGLEKMQDVLKIMDSAAANDVASLVTRIDASDKNNYILWMENEKKIVYMGDGTNLSNRMLYLKVILEDNKGLEGEIFVNGDLNTQKAFFRLKE